MDTNGWTVIWAQLGAALDMLDNAMNACPEELWKDRSRRPEFWYLVYHTLFWLDHDLSESVGVFAPPEPCTLEEMDPAGLLPERPYTKDEMCVYLEHGRQRCREALGDTARPRRGCERVGVSLVELLLYQMRHVQHHAAQLNLMLRQNIDSAPRWVRRTKIPAA